MKCPTTGIAQFLNLSQRDYNSLLRRNSYYFPFTYPKTRGSNKKIYKCESRWIRMNINNNINKMAYVYINERLWSIIIFWNINVPLKYLHRQRVWFFFDFRIREEDSCKRKNSRFRDWNEERSPGFRGSRARHEVRRVKEGWKTKQQPLSGSRIRGYGQLITFP